MILERTAPLFNQQGYAGVSLSDIMQVTELEKGGIYNHFASKEQLALEAFDYAWELVYAHTSQALAGKKHALDRLHAFADVFRSLADGSLLPGGCPLLNMAVEADDTHPLLLAHVRAAMDLWFANMRRILEKGMARQELRPDIQIEEYITLFIATLEGAVMLTRLFNDLTYMERAIADIHMRINALALSAV